MQLKFEIKHLRPPVFISTIQNKIGNMRTKWKNCVHRQALLTMMVMIVICVVKANEGFGVVVE